MGNSDSETELKRKKEKKHKDKDSGDERKERRDREKEEKKVKTDKGKEERKEKKDKEKEHGDKDKGKEERKEKMDKGKEERKEKKEKGKEDKGKEKDEKKKHKEGKYHDDTKHKPSHPSGSESHASSGPIDAHDGKATSHYKPSGTPDQPSHSGEIPWFLREPDTGPVHQQPSQINPNFPIQSPPPHQYSVHPPSQQQPFHAVAGGVPSTQNVPPSGHRVPLSPNDHFPTPDRLGPPPATDSGGSIPVYIGSAIFPDSVHPCRIVPSLNPPCRILYGRGEVGHHGRYDLLPVTQDMEWVPAKLGELPPGRRPVEGGYESNGDKLYHALGSVQGAYVLGKAGKHLRGAIIPFGGNEHHVQENYSVLCWK